MKVICPTCQYENQCNSSQVFCARCATMIDVRSQREEPLGGVGQSGRSGPPLPYSGNGNGYGDDQSGQRPGYPGASPRAGRGRDAYATRVGDDFDDLLEINPPSGGRVRGETTPLNERDLFDQLPPAGHERSVDTPAMGRQTVDAIRPDYGGQTWQSEDGGGYDPRVVRPADPAPSQRGRETREFSDEMQPHLMGWPVLTDNSDLEDDEMEEDPGARQGFGMRILLGTAVFAGLIGGAYFFLGDLISKRQDQAEGLVVNQREGGAPVTSPTLSPMPEVQTSPLPVGQADQGASAVASGGQSQPVDIPPVIGRNVNPAPAVAIPVMPEPAPARPTAAAIPENGDWTIQAASFNNKQQADERLAGLRGAGIPARVARVDLGGKGTWYRIQIGGFGSREEGARYGNQLRSRGAIQDFIVTPR